MCVRAMKTKTFDEKSKSGAKLASVFCSAPLHQTARIWACYTFKMSRGYLENRTGRFEYMSVMSETRIINTKVQALARKRRFHDDYQKSETLMIPFSSNLDCNGNGNGNGNGNCVCYWQMTVLKLNLSGPGCLHPRQKATPEKESGVSKKKVL